VKLFFIINGIDDTRYSEKREKHPLLRRLEAILNATLEAELGYSLPKKGMALLKIKPK
jgi:hypothetical protein